MHKTTTINFCVASLELELLSSIFLVLRLSANSNLIAEYENRHSTHFNDYIRPFSRAFLAIGSLPAQLPVNFWRKIQLNTSDICEFFTASLSVDLGIFTAYPLWVGKIKKEDRP